MDGLQIDSAAAEHLMAFWADAGVDVCYEDAPVDRTRLILPPARTAVLKATAAVVAAPDASACVSEARRLAQAAMTLDALSSAATAFDGCDLKHQGARRAVVGAGASDADVLVIAPAPTREADETGDLLAGPCGRLLQAMLAAAGLTERAWIMNAVFWRPPGDRPAAPEEQAACLPFLERALELQRPRAVLLLGAGPARTVAAPGENLMALRGRWIDWRLSEGDVAAPAIITLSPAFLLKQPQAKAMAWADLLTLMARLDATD